jgi:hypothetical protein
VSSLDQYLSWKANGEVLRPDVPPERRLEPPLGEGAFIAYMLPSSYAGIEGVRWRS